MYLFDVAHRAVRGLPRPAGRVTAVAAAALTAAAIAGCQVQPGAAAFVGGERIPQSEVDTLASSSLAAAKRTVGTTERVQLRQSIMSQLVISELVDRRARQLGVRVTDAQVQREIDQSAQEAGGREQFLAQQAQQGLSPQLLEDQIRVQLMLRQIQGKIGANNPSDAELRAAYEANGGLAQIGQPYAQVRSQLIQYVAGQKLQADITAVAKAAKIRVNPRNGSFDLASLSVRGLQDKFVRASGQT